MPTLIPRIQSGIAMGTCAAVFALPLLIWPNIRAPFSTPKWWLMVLWGLVLGISLLLKPSQLAPFFKGSISWALLGWMAAVSLSALSSPTVSLTALLALMIPLAWMLWSIVNQHTRDRLILTILLASGVVAVIALMQFCGWDPFICLLGWHPERFRSSRMAVYSTFGNPNFVAAWLCMTWPLYFRGLTSSSKNSARGYFIGVSAAGFQLLAILATGSRVFVIAALMMLLMLLCSRAPRMILILSLVLLPASVGLLWMSPARPLGKTLSGRWALIYLTASHLPEVPLFGFGPGSFSLKFAEWQTLELQKTGSVKKEYTEPLDHAHNDFLEYWVELGPAGIAAGLVLLVALVGKSFLKLVQKKTSLSVVFPLATVMVALGIALVDFPFHRPAEWLLFWILLGICHTDTADI